jgi:phospholipase C
MIAKILRGAASVLTAAAVTFVAPGSMLAQPNNGNSDHVDIFSTNTPVQHVIVIFQENVSFDHYFGTYPYATNPPNESRFERRDDTPRVNNLLAGGLLDSNPNSQMPFRLDPSQAYTCDQNHGYTAEQKAFDHGLMDKFPESTAVDGSTGGGCPDYGHGLGIVMGYYDGNTTTALWNYAQHYAMSDNAAGTMFGPSTPGALNLAVGTTENATLVNGNANGVIANGASMGVDIGDADPAMDDCSPATKTHLTITGQNIGDLLNAKGITWGWFQGGFAPTSVSAMGVATCGATSTSTIEPAIGTVTDYVPHHEPFQYFESTRNPHHLPPTSDANIGKTDQANHQYDLSLFFTALTEGRLPAVSFLKAKAIQNGHPGNSDPLDEQVFIATVVNAVENSSYWRDTAIIINYDDSDGWYDHQMNPIVNQSMANDDQLAGTGSCGSVNSDGNPGRCGYGPRLPYIVISKFAKQNYVDHRQIDQSSTIRFIEDNWSLGRIGGGSNDAKAGKIDGLFDFDDPGRAPKIIVDPSTGLIIVQNDF